MVEDRQTGNVGDEQPERIVSSRVEFVVELLGRIPVSGFLQQGSYELTPAGSILEVIGVELVRQRNKKSLLVNADPGSPRPGIPGGENVVSSVGVQGGFLTLTVDELVTVRGYCQPRFGVRVDPAGNETDNEIASVKP